MRYNSYSRIAFMLLILSAFTIIGPSVGAQLSLPSISLCDYTIPETTYQDLGLTFSYLFYDDPNLSSEGDISKGSASGNYTYIYSNPDYSINLNSNANLSLSDSDLSYNAFGAGRYNFYPIVDNNLFLFGGLRVDFSDGFAEIAGVKATTGTGFGRFKNVTPMVKAVLIDQMLIERNAISRHLPEGTLQGIAQNIGAIGPETEIAAVVDDIVTMIERTGAVTVGGLGAIEVLRVRETVENSIDQRLCGWEIRAGAAYEILDPQAGVRDILLDAAARYAHPFTPYSQLLLEVDFASTFEVTENFTVKGLADYTYKVGENFDTMFQYSLLYQQGETEAFYHQNFNAKAEVQLNSNMSANANASLTLDSNYEEMAKEISIGLSYEIF